MLLRKLTRAVREQDWFTSILELILLIVGIFIGFQLDRWNTDRLAQKEANEYSIQLLDDLNVEHSDVENLIVYFGQVRDFGAQALTAWQEQPGSTPEELIVAFYQASNILPFASIRGAYDALSSRGMMSLVAGPEFGSQLSAYYAQGLNAVINQPVPYRMQVRGVLPNKVQGMIRSSCSHLSGGGLLVEDLLDHCEINLPSDEAREILQALKEHPHMQLYLRQSISTNSVAIYVLESKIQTIKSLQDKLKSIQMQRAVN